ncbi:TonB-dependent receptor [Saccharophagus degradans]|uniref:TonB-dependent receptor n=1 Tax=Saccharophagus degradans (strain 2-40 / ATCC 43961 / DSM 17024) TaxID=203122 RepID=Q21ID1_SACD2|nr:TonB-dependent receptor [Saccharophagus degradans]ABD81548.1 TonB-dependent receptor [Saccharophagus degradans 2-40]
MYKRSALSSSIAIAVALTSQYSLAQNEADASLEEVIVTGIRGSLTKALDMKRENTQIVDSIVAEDIGKFPDNNVVEALQRVSGVQVTDRGAGEVNTVSIRGLTDVTTTVNGRQIFTSTGRSVALADIPASLVAGVDVYKTRSASQIESGIAGQVDIKTQRPFNFDGSKVVIAARGTYQEQAEKTDPNLSALFSNRWETSAGEFGALLNVSFAQTNYRDQSVTPGAQVPFMTANAADGWVPFERIFPTDGRVTESPIWEGGLEEGLPATEGSTLTMNGEEIEYLLSRDAIFASDFTGKRERPAYNVAFQFAPNETSEYLFEAFYNGYRNESFNSLLFSFADWWGSLDPADEVVTYPGTNIVKERTVYNPYGFNSGDLTVSQTDSYVYALGGNWDIGDNLTLESEIVHQTSEYSSDFFAMRTDRVAHGIDVDFNSSGGLPAWAFIDNPETADVNEADLTDSAQWNVAELYDNGVEDKGTSTTFTVDGSYSLFNSFFTNIDFGASYDVRTAQSANRDINGFLGQPLSSLDAGASYVTEDFYDGRADIPTTWVVPNGHYIYSHRDEFRDLYGFTSEENIEKLSLKTNFDIEETTTAVYVQTDFETELGNGTLGGQFGVRYVGSSADMSFFDNEDSSTADRSDSALLPSLVLKYEFANDFMARFAYTETLRRPAFGQLNSFIYYNESVTNTDGTATGGNPDLKPVESVNLDLSLEWYFAEGSALYGTLFQRNIEGFVFDSRQRVSYQGPDDTEASDYILSLPDNASNGELNGLELGLVYFPDNLPNALDGLGVQASYTMLDSSQDVPVFGADGELEKYLTRSMFGVSDNSYSVVVAYEKEKFSARLSFLARDNFLNNYEAAVFANPLGVYRKPEKSMDLQLSYDVTDDLMLTFDATNLTDEVFQSYYENPQTNNLGNAIYSRTFSLGLRYTY